MCNRTHKLTLDLDLGAGEMYGLQNDLHELNNVFDDPDAKPMRKELEASIAPRSNDVGPDRVPVAAA